MRGAARERSAAGGGEAVPAFRIGQLRALLFYLALTVEIAIVIVDKSELHDPFESYLFRGTFVLTLFTVLLGDYTAREWAVIAAAAGFGFLCYRITGRNELLRMVVFVAACKGRPRERMLGVTFRETLAGCAGIALLSITGIFGACAMTAASRPEEGERVRYCLGFGHPNALHAMFFMLVLLGMLIYEEKLRLSGYLLLFLANLGLYLLTGSRTGAGMTALALLLGAFLCGDDARAAARREGRASSGERPPLRGQGWPYFLGMAVVLFCVGFSVWAAHASYYIGYRGEKPLLTRVVLFFNGLLNDRIAELYWVAEPERADLASWTLFSSRSAERCFDMGWCRLFYWYGILPAVFIIVLVLLLIAECGRRRDAMGLVVIVCGAIYTVSEAHLVSVYIGRNFLLLLLGAYGSGMLRADRGAEFGLGRLFAGRAG